jgi:putative oxidoreductase
MDTGILVFRLVLGLAMAAHGAQKLFGWFGGYGIKGTGGFLESLGFRPGPLFAFAAGFSETVGGLLVALGFLGPIGPALVISVMIIAAFTVHSANGFFAMSNGVELPLLYAAGAFALAFSGFGTLSFDAVLGLQHLWTTQIDAIVLVIGAIGGFANLTLRRTHTQVAAHA